MAGVYRSVVLCFKFNFGDSFYSDHYTHAPIRAKARDDVMHQLQSMTKCVSQGDMILVQFFSLATHLPGGYEWSAVEWVKINSETQRQDTWKAYFSNELDFLIGYLWSKFNDWQCIFTFIFARGLYCDPFELVFCKEWHTVCSMHRFPLSMFIVSFNFETTLCLAAAQFLLIFCPRNYYSMPGKPIKNTACSEVRYDYCVLR